MCWTLRSFRSFFSWFLKFCHQFYNKKNTECHYKKINTRLNQTVIRGEPVALTANGTTPEIYVELRDSDAKPIDPGDWFAKLSH